MAYLLIPVTLIKKTLFKQNFCKLWDNPKVRILACQWRNGLLNKPCVVGTTRLKQPPIMWLVIYVKLLEHPCGNTLQIKLWQFIRYPKIWSCGMSSKHRTLRFINCFGTHSTHRCTNDVISVISVTKLNLAGIHCANKTFANHQISQKLNFGNVK
jgi:hypothetical protein